MFACLVPDLMFQDFVAIARVKAVCDNPHLLSQVHPPSFADGAGYNRSCELQGSENAKDQDKASRQPHTLRSFAEKKLEASFTGRETKNRCKNANGRADD
mmetsp:Transcript_103084/g.204693  ORF Transcript_103084/g.204693 Transcript_103084/m.204693 type:complete len:100 (-) Transcript_103084:2368-2667(-)